MAQQPAVHRQLLFSQMPNKTTEQVYSNMKHNFFKWELSETEGGHLNSLENAFQIQGPSQKKPHFHLPLT